MNDKGSQPHCAKVEVQGVPMFGIVDSGADITIIGAELFKKVAAVAKLHKKDFKKSDKSPHGYDGQPFTLDGRMDSPQFMSRWMLRTSSYCQRECAGS